MNHDAAPYSSPRVRFALTLGAASALAVWFVVFVRVGYPWTMIGYFTDALFYLLSADALTHGVAAAGSETGAMLLAVGRFPPGYSLYLSLFGADRTAEGMVMANIAQMVAVLMLIVVALDHYRRRAGSLWLALFAALYVVSTGAIHPWALELASEPLFMAMLLALCTLAVAQHVPRRWLWMAIVLGLACLVRKMGVVLIPVLVVHVWRSAGDWRKAILAGVLAALPTMAWQAYQTLSGQQAATSYVAELHNGLGMIGSWWGTLPERLARVALATAPYLLPLWAKLCFVALMVLAVLPPAWAALKRLDFTAWSALMLLATLIAWPYPEHMDRLMGPVVVLIASLVVAGGISSWRPTDRASSRWKSAVGAALAALIAVGVAQSTLWLASMPGRIADPALAPYLRSFVGHNRSDPRLEFENYHQIMLASEMLQSVVPADACVDTTMSLLISLRTRARLRLMTAPHRWEASPCDYLLAINSRGGTDPPALYPLGDPTLPAHDEVFRTVTSEGFPSAVLLRRR